MADIGERLGGDDLKFSIDQPLRIIIGGPPHSGKSTLMNLLEDRFQYYQIPVQLLDLDLSAPTPLKTGFTEQREKRKWTSSLADEARSMFEEAEGVQVVLGDSVGLISEINEIISQPADVAILLVSGGHGDYDDTYRKVVRKWKEYYEDIRKPLLVVLRSTMNPRDESMFDPRDNYGIIAGLDRDAYQSQVISGHYNYEGDFPTNACLEGIVFEIAQSFDLTVRSPTDPDHLSILNQKWPDLKDKKTWTPPEGSMLGGIERAYFEERGRVPADQRAEYYTKYYLPNRLDPKVGDEAMFEGGEIRITNMESNPDVIFYTYLDEDGKSDGFIHTRDIAQFVDRWSPFPMEKDTVILSNYGDKDDLSFKEWADQEMLTHGNKESFDEWLNDELSHHGDNVSLHDWGNHELDSHYERYGAESDEVKTLKAIYTPYIGKQVRFITKYGLDKDDMFVDIETIHSIDWDSDEGEYDEPVFLNKEGDRWMTLDYVKENLVENKEAEMANWSGRPKTSKPYRGLESKTRKRIKQEAAYSQMMIGSLIGLGAGLWAVSRWKENQEGQ